MDEQLFELIYCSRSGAAAVESKIAGILAVSRRNNERDGITGALLFSAGYFAQVLEGPADAVERRFERIRVDPDHYDVVILSSGASKSRAFSNWAMGYIATADLSGNAAALARAFDTPDQSKAILIREMLRQSIALTEVWGTILPEGAV